MPISLPSATFRRLRTSASGLKDITLDTIKELLTVDKASWLEDVENIKAFYAQVGDRVPETMYDELAALEARLKA